MMKKILYPFLCIVVGLTSCVNLDVDIKSELVPENFPTTEEQFVAASGVVYTEFAKGYTDNYWLQSELTADVGVITANGGNWFDGGIYQDFHYHDWTYAHSYIENTWSWLYKTINSCNKVYSLLIDAEDSDSKHTTIAELRTMRAFCYYLLMDNFGGVPLVVEFGEDLKPRSSRQEVFDYVEKELKEALPDLRTVNDVSTWGRPTQLAAYAMLAKLYLNAEVFTGTSKYDEAVAMCDAVMAFENRGETTLTDRSQYLNMFDYDNGPDFKEYLFAIPYDENSLQSFRPSRYALSIYHPEAWNFKFTVSSCMRILPDYYDLYEDDTEDVRLGTFLVEEQYMLDGVTPMTVTATKVQLDSRYDGEDKEAVVDYHIRMTKEIEFRDIATFDTGDDVVGRLVGYRCNKYPASTTQPDHYHSNDFPVLRYADVLLMKAEAILRGAAATHGDTPLALVNRIRERVGAKTWSAVTLDQLLEERGRELVLEAWRRNDLIRFGKFEDSWLLKTDADVRKRLFPIPKTEMDTNTLLEQNPGY
ncbi:MAG: RagB/SusD family nutrient uptake outer membrane protein [Tannerellaceae bacterium]|nr:RagB/SusD family nutrient uptake outer membrane protein [Tannerellaceae bacterium]